jgi:hypothetical protein
MADLKLAREKAHAALQRARSGTRAVEDIGPIVIERFTRTMRENLTTGEVPFRKAYLGSPRLRCVVRPDRAQAALLQRLGLRLPERLRMPTGARQM